MANFFYRQEAPITYVFHENLTPKKIFRAPEARENKEKGRFLMSILAPKCMLFGGLEEVFTLK